MSTIITTFTEGVGRGAITVNQSVEEISRAINEGGGTLITLTNTDGQKVAIRAESICGMFESTQTPEGPEVTIGRAGFGAAMMQMSVSHGGSGD